ncbi:polyketide synthase [Colletotrichum tofieldiae]|nr:polyketide synthase [Colletotrichum tofieldiae]
MTIRVACAASGLALHLACQAIRAGECDAAIVAGSNIILSPDFGLFMAEHGILSPDASCRTFDAQANGYARAEAVNCVFIKRYDLALRDGNPVRAIIRGSATNADGKTVGMSTPSPEAHEALIRSAYRMAGIQDLCGTAMVECHGTGTTVGDAVETCAIARVFGEKGVIIGSTKPALGHSEGASALTSVIKAVLSLEHRTIIPNIKFHSPSLRPTLLLFSAGNEESLLRYSEQYLSYYKLHPDRLTDLSYTLARRRLHQPLRSYRVIDEHGKPHPTATTTLCNRSSPQKGTAGINFVFTGQGASWARMGVDLLKSDPTFLQDIRAMDAILKALPPGRRPSWTIQGELIRPETSSRLGQAEFSQPICAALQIALVRRLERHGVVPGAVVGHSSGEVAAAYAAGALSLEDAVTAAYYRGLVCRKSSGGGGSMVCVGMGRAEVSQFLVSEVTVACENSNASVTLSGPVEALQQVTEAVRTSRPDAFVRPLRVNNAYHSSFMAGAAEEYLSLLQTTLRPKTPAKPFYSSVSGRLLGNASDFGARYWRDNMLKPVLFRQAVKALLADHSVSVHIEIGPHPALSGPLKQIGTEAGMNFASVPVMSRGASAVVTFLATLGELHCRGIPADLPIPQDAKALGDMPPYPWDLSKTYWPESRVMRAWRFRKFPPHELLGIRNADDSDISPTWRCMLSADNVPWIKDHCVGSDIVFPAAAYVAMAGGIVFQLTGKRAYTVRELSITTAMTLEAGCHLEVMAAVRPTTEQCEWREFSIQSCKDDVWTTHCTGVVRPGRISRGPPIRRESSDTYLRVVDPQAWYRCIARVGYKYGPEFRGLEDIRASVSSPSVKLVVSEAESPTGAQRDPTACYALHPKTLDKIFQALNVAFHSGHPRLVKRLSMPTYAEEIFVDDGISTESLHVNATATTACVTGPGKSRGDVVAYTSPNPKEDPVFYAKGFCFSPGAQEPLDAEPHGAIQMVWKPSLDLLDPSPLLCTTTDTQHAFTQRLLESFSVICAIVIRDAADLLPESSRAVWPSHFTKLHAWLDEYIARNGHLADAALASIIARDTELVTTYEALKHGPAADAATLMLRCATHAEYILAGASSALDLFLQDGALHRLYDWMNSLWSYEGYLELVSHQRGNHLRVLEIGAGTGGLTARVLEGLRATAEDGEMHGAYVFTDISAGFFAAAKERFKDWAGVEYRTLDITRDPMAQGFEREGYDLVIASNVLHVTEDVTKTLRHVRSLLKPGGQLLMQELACEIKWINLIMGFLPGWWLGEPDSREEEPYMSPDQWNERLLQAGFSSPDCVVLDAEPPYHLNATIIARPASLPSKTSPSRAVQAASGPQVTLLHDEESLSTQASHLADLLLQHGCKPTPIRLGEPMLQGPVISLLDLSSSPPGFFTAMTQEKLDALNALLEMLKKTDSPLLWLTKPCQVCPTDPSYAPVLGVARTARQELGVRFAVLELDSCDFRAMAAAWQVMSRKLSRPRPTRLQVDDLLDDDMEFVYCSETNCVLIPRSTWISVPQALINSRPEYPDTQTSMALQITRPGHLHTLSYAPRNHPPVLSSATVQIRIHAAGLNFKDVLTALNISSLLASSGPAPLGCEAAGIVTAVGASVSRVCVGDRVMLFAPQAGCFSTSVRIPDVLCTRIPDEMSFEDAAGMPCVFATVLRALVDKARLGPGRTVLVHSAAGGVGLAAVQIARWLGAEVFATVGSEAKREFLRDAVGIDPRNVFSSRDDSFADGLLAATEGRGVDVVLNSLSGELLHASWRCVAPGGTFVELGKRDVAARCKLAMEPLDDNRAFIGIDMSRLAVLDGGEIGRLLDQIIHLHQEHALTPIAPLRTFLCSEIQEAFQYLAKGTHIGKIVVDFVDERIDQASLPLSPDQPEPVFCPDPVYIIAGGIGGLGASIIRWLAHHGARNFAILSRSAGSSGHGASIIAELRGMGCTVRACVCDIADEDAVRAVMSGISRSSRIGGVIHLAMILADVELSRMTVDEWQAAVAPKVAGTWNLHRALGDGGEEDFFVLIGSMFGVTGRVGQANYAAANTFLDSFVQFRRGLGMPCSVLDVGPVEDVGTLTRKPELREAMWSAGARFLTEQDVLDGLYLAIVKSREGLGRESGTGHKFRCPAQVGIGFRCTVPLDNPQNSVVWKRDPRMAFYNHIDHESRSDISQAASTSVVLNQFVCRVRDRPSELDNPACALFLAREIARRVLTSLMMVDEDGSKADASVTMPLSSFGMDSLLTIEIRNWWRAVFGVDVNLMQLTSAPSFEHLGKLVARQMKEKFCAPNSKAS